MVTLELEDSNSQLLSSAGFSLLETDKHIEGPLFATWSYLILITMLWSIISIL